MKSPSGSMSVSGSIQACNPIDPYILLFIPHDMAVQPNVEPRMGLDKEFAGSLAAASYIKRMLGPK